MYVGYINGRIIVKTYIFRMACSREYLIALGEDDENAVGEYSSV